MINGIIKLFYSEVVKTKIKNLPSSEYQLRDECKDIQNITLKIDSIFFKGLKFIFGLFILIFAFNIKIILGIEVLLLELAYIVYKRNLEIQVKEQIENIKNSIEVTSVNLLDERGKSGINVLISLLIMGVLSGFNYILVLSFLAVFLFTIKHICSNIK
ncbi:hypothetical protein [Romboutsia sp. Marseille-P6047]|uniref:hypothetical protein n=1 Tax=Romboutsia sp. Marseille-P6047 TaxID=2161817 RepID=UPI0008224C52|nr:hypothetical protein [Romboutsia sp. Marseille-P6047]SCH17243.1 Uncharacterised protein [uncultured Clostridium sp.]